MAAKRTTKKATATPSTEATFRVVRVVRTGLTEDEAKTLAEKSSRAWPTHTYQAEPDSADTAE